MNVDPNLSILDGTEQQERFPRALERGYFQPDERRFEELLAAGLEFARTLVFYDLQNQPAGTWGDLFKADESVVMAHILSADTVRLEYEFSKCREKGIEHAVLFTYETVQKVNSWLCTLGDSNSRPALELSARFEALVSKGLTRQLQKFREILAVLGESMPSLAELDFSGFHRLWGSEPVEGDVGHSGGRAVPTREPELIREDISRIFASILNVIAHLRAVVPPYLAESLESKRHEPAIALFMVFLKLLETAGDKLNRFTDRHLDFYYQRVLGAVSRQHKPDHLFFSLQPAQGQHEVRIPAGTGFVTGMGEAGGDIVFESERDVLVSDARVETLCTLRFERDRLISPEKDFGYVTRIKALQRDLDHAQGAADTVSEWPLFGTSSRLAGYKSAQDARIGFAVASPLLLLREGRRTIEIQIEFRNPEALNNLKNFRQSLLKDIFDLSLTVPAGWYLVDSYVLTHLRNDLNGTCSRLKFRLTLGPEVEPIVSYAPEIHGGQWGGTSPLIRFQLNPRASFCAYSLLNDLQLEAVVIDVKVQGLRDLKLYNDLGRIDPSKPFQPFGPLPTLSSYFVLGSYEMAQKQLTGLTVNLEWGNLPACFGGFATHYSGHDQTVADEAFQVELSVLQEGNWQPKLERQRTVVSLFQPTGSTDKLNATRSIEIKDLDYVHPVLLAKALSENIRTKKLFKKTPNAPYTPLISDVSLDYQARARIRVDERGSARELKLEQRVFHLHPFGYEEFRATGAGNPHSLLPKYATDGNLFIGISGGRAGQMLTLFFHLNEETNQQIAYDNPAITWYYLSAQGWQPLPATNIVLDRTNGFICSGIVTLLLPEELDRQSTLMPAGKAWLRIGANAHLDSLPRLFSVHTNVIRATRSIDPVAVESFIRHLPVGCAWRTALPIPGLDEVVQVGGSHGGVPTEDRRRFLTRISERLRHKDRAVTAWDYERLILERFPNLFKVKCFDGLVSSDF
jgi:hypothetical protein